MASSQLDPSGWPLILGVVLPTLGIAGCSSSAPPPPSPLIASIHSPADAHALIAPTSISLGVLNPGQAAQAMFTLRNPTAGPVDVARLETSCHCLRVTPRSFRIGPGEPCSLRAAFDPAHEPDFQGVLAVIVTGRETDGDVVFRTVVKLDVRPHAPQVPEQLASSRSARLGRRGHDP